MRIIEIYEKQKQYFDKGLTQSYEFRLEALKKLKNSILNNEKEILEGLHKDLRKPLAEAYSSEIAIVIKELNYALKHLKTWMKPTKVRGDILTLGGVPHIYHEPYGLSLIIGTWNYPINLALTPLIGAIAGGNTAIIKPSEVAEHTSKVVFKIISEAFDEEYIAVIEGDVTIVKELLFLDFDKIFFTGSPEIGKSVMVAAAKNLSSVTLELGGKSPCIIDKGVNMKTVVQRVIFGKLMNNGQTCIAPDYVIIHEEAKEEFYKVFKEVIQNFYGEDVKSSPDLTRIINKRHFNRLKEYLNHGEIIFGGKYHEEELFIEPTLIEPFSLNERIMKEELFGPILPVVTFRNFEEIRTIIKMNPNPLALYVFSNNVDLVENIIDKIPCGGVAVNDTLSHIIGDKLPFGGRKTSGLGNYHGKYSFKIFTHDKSVLRKNLLLELSLKYPPYKDMHKWIKKFMLK